MDTVNYARGILAVTRTSTVQVVNRALIMDKGLGDNAALLPNPMPGRPQFASQIALVQQAQVAVVTRKGTAAARNVQLGILWGMMKSELQYIQSVADQGTPEQAIMTLQAGGVAIALIPRRQKELLTITQAQASGPVVLDANVGMLLGSNSKRYRFFGWECTGDGGKTIVTLPSTPKGKTTVTGLTPLTVYGFRVNVTPSSGIPGAWSQFINFLVH